MPPPKDPAKREEWRRKLSLVNKGKVPHGTKGTPEWEAWLQCVRHGRAKFANDPVAQKQWRERLSSARKGKKRISKVSDETRMRISNSLKGRKKPPRSAVHCLNISLANRGRRASDATRQRLRDAMKARVISPKHRASLRLAAERKRGIPRNPETIAKMVATNRARVNYVARPHVVKLIGDISRNRKRTEQEKEKIAAALRGRKRDPEIARKASETKRARRTAPYPEKRQKDPRYHPWRRAVLSRDGYACKRCGHQSKSNHAHHLQEWSIAPELRYEVANAVTLCNGCHTRTHHEERRKQRAKPV